MPNHAQRLWLARHRVYDSENPIPPTNAAPPRDFFTALERLDDRQAPATRADIDALREEVRELRAALVPAVSPIATGPGVLAEFERLLEKGG